MPDDRNLALELMNAHLKKERFAANTAIAISVLLLLPIIYGLWFLLLVSGFLALKAAYKRASVEGNGPKWARLIVKCEPQTGMLRIQRRNFGYEIQMKDPGSDARTAVTSQSLGKYHSQFQEFSPCKVYVEPKNTALVVVLPDANLVFAEWILPYDPQVQQSQSQN